MAGVSTGSSTEPSSRPSVSGPSSADLIAGVAPPALPKRSAAEWKAADGIVEDPVLRHAIRAASSIPEPPFFSVTPGLEKDYFASPLTAQRVGTLTKLVVPCGVTTLAGLQHAADLTWLDVCAETRDLDLAPIAHLHPTTLTLTGAELTDLSVVKTMGVKTLFIGPAPKLTDLTPLAGSSTITLLNLNGTTVSDVTPIGSLAKVEEISLSDSPITDLTPLIPLGRLGTLWRISITRIPATDAQPLQDIDVALRAAGGSLTTLGSNSFVWDAVK